MKFNSVSCASIHLSKDGLICFGLFVLEAAQISAIDSLCAENVALSIL